VSDSESEEEETARPTTYTDEDIDRELGVEEPVNKRQRNEDLEDFTYHEEFNTEDLHIPDIDNVNDLGANLDEITADFDTSGSSYAPLVTIDHKTGQLVQDHNRAIITDARRSDTDYNEYERVTEASGSSRYITQATFSKRAKATGKRAAARWTDDDTELFYKGLRQFGPDFSMISRLFPYRTRRDIKNKHKREERENPEEMDAAIFASNMRLAINVEEFKKSSDLKDQLEGIVRKQRDPNEEEDHHDEPRTRGAGVGDGVEVQLRQEDRDENHEPNNDNDDLDDFDVVQEERHIIELGEDPDLNNYNQYISLNGPIINEDAVLDEDATAYADDF
jgi:hypothetical protein